MKTLGLGHRRDKVVGPGDEYQAVNTLGIPQRILYCGKPSNEWAKMDIFPKPSRLALIILEGSLRKRATRSETGTRKA